MWIKFLYPAPAPPLLFCGKWKVFSSFPHDSHGGKEVEDRVRKEAVGGGYMWMMPICSQSFQEGKGEVGRRFLEEGEEEEKEGPAHTLQCSNSN